MMGSAWARKNNKKEDSGDSINYFSPKIRNRAAGYWIQFNGFWLMKMILKFKNYMELIILRAEIKKLDKSKSESMW